MKIDFISPMGEAFWPALNRTETYKGKDTGKFTMKLVLTGKALEDMRTKINDALVDAYGPKKAEAVWKEKPPIKTTKDGSKAFIKYTANAVINDKPRIIALFDSQDNLITRPLSIGSGSIIRVNGSMSLFEAKDPGMWFSMNSIQVIKYVEYVPGGGFAHVPDGFIG
ncbi:hypothetical protein [Acidocella sp. MX-AZ02]|uniref:hypothetical protein n=1 Tax=Acidocella sp. MX-AZ02 TaxID=1214225 RepID=UPI00028DECF3|nr:hypothetical protein [Acidocella sp. MX-AZ02]EKN00829.1 hypothetical protein MXAZACID_03434 [Acidocella sp. MX-AZ02]